MPSKAWIIGSGPNGLAAAIVLAQSGMAVDVYEAEPTIGGAARTLPLTLPGFLHDFGSAVHPLAAGSPFFTSLPLSGYGLQWIHPAAPLGHPLDDGTAVILERNLNDAQNAFGSDGATWAALVRPFVEHWTELAPEILKPQPSFPKLPFLMARFGMNAFRPARSVAHRFRSPRTRALFAGLAAHSFLSLDEPLSTGVALTLAVLAHAVGWPIPRGGAQSISNALAAHLLQLGGTVKTSSRIQSLTDIPEYRLLLCDVNPQQLSQIAGARLSHSYRNQLQSFPPAPGVFKVDYALSQPIPWRAKDCARAATVHLGGTFEEIAVSERAMRDGKHADLPFVLLSQPSLFDPARAPAGQHTAWAYCHVPNGSTVDMLPRLEAQIERFAPGFRECVLARRVFSTVDLHAMDANLVGGDISGGLMDLRHFFSRPTWRHYATSAPDIFLCSASTPPGGGVHGMCGFHAANMALSRLK